MFSTINNYSKKLTMSTGGISSSLLFQQFHCGRPAAVSAAAAAAAARRRASATRTAIMPHFGHCRYNATYDAVMNQNNYNSILLLSHMNRKRDNLTMIIAWLCNSWNNICSKSSNIALHSVKMKENQWQPLSNGWYQQHSLQQQSQQCLPMQHQQQQIRYMSKYLSNSATKRLPLTSKRAKKGYYKGNRSTKEGRHTSKGKYVMDVNKMLQLIVPSDLDTFELKPYIAKTASKKSPEKRSTKAWKNL